MKTNKLFLSFILILFQCTVASCSNNVSTSTTSISNKQKSYTLNSAITSSPKAWNPHNWELSDENYIPSFTTMGFYQIALNSTKDGYEILNEMALEAPLDVSSKITKQDKEKYGYLGQVGEGYVYDIELNPNACFEDGSEIKASDYVLSMERLLSPKMANYRADTMYASNLVIANAETYFKQGKTTIEPLYNYLKDSSDGTPTSENILQDNTFYLNLGKNGPYFNTIFPNQTSEGSLYTCISSRTRAASNEAEFAGQRIVDAAQYYIYTYVNHDDNSSFDSVEKYSDINDDEKLNCDIDIYDFDSNCVYVRSSKDVTMDLDDPSTYERYSSNSLKKDLRAFVSDLGGNMGVFSKSWCYELPLFANMENNETCTFDKVGIKEIDDYTIRLFLKQKISSFDLQFSLTSSWLVNVKLYDELTKIIPGSTMYATSYASDNASNYMSYGPYKLESFQKDKAIIMVKNDAWYGYHDGKHENQYQCTRIVTQIVKDHSTKRQLFLSGQLDSLELEKSDIKDYGKSSKIKYVPESYTQKISLNSDRTKLKSRQEQTPRSDDNKTILNNLKFRKALSLAIDRREFASVATTGSQASTNLINSLYFIDSKNGITYRSTDQGKKVYEKVYGELGGENGGEMLNPNEVASGYTDNRSGYNKAYATKLIGEAIEEEKNKEDGYRNGQTVVIEFLVSQSPSESETIRDAITYLSAAFNEVASPNNMTIEIDFKKDADYYTTAANGNYDMIYSIWGGATNNPYGLMQVYADAHFAKTCEYGFKGHQSEENLEIEFSDGSKATKTYYAWFDDIIKNLVEPSLSEGEEWTESKKAEYDRLHTKRLDVLAGLEAGILSRFEAIPLVSRSNANITSFKVEYGTNRYVTYVGYGGIRETKFNYSDEEWEEFLKSHNNNLTEDYKK